MRLSTFIKAIVFVVALGLIGKGSYIQTKAMLAQHLIEYSFYKNSQTYNKVKPWPWADTHVLAKLKIGSTTSFVLSDANMRNLAFGPAHITGTPLPGDNGNSVIVGHRDTHFAHLENVQIGQSISLSSENSDVFYRVEEIMVVDDEELGILANMSQTALTLITCYPFNSVSPNPNKRFVVRAIKET